MGNRQDRELATGVRKGDPESFDRIYELLKVPIYNFVYQMVGDAEEAKDITQESFLAMYNVLKENKKVDNLKAYLYAIARNNALQKIDKRSREYVDDDFIMRLPDENYYSDPARFSANRKQQVDITRALQMMPENYREVLVLREQAGFSYDRIASMLGTNKTNVGVLIYRARAKFRELYRMLQVTQEPATPECESILPLISSWLDGETTSKQEQELQKHMTECPFCKLASEQMVDANQTYHALIPLAVPLTVKAGLMAQAGLAGIVPTSLAASATGYGAVGGAVAASSAGVASGSVPTGISAGVGSTAAAIGSGSVAGTVATGVSAKAIGIIAAVVIAAGALGGGTYTGIRIQAHRHAVALESELKAQIDDFVNGTRTRVRIPPELRRKANDIKGAASAYAKRYLSDLEYKDMLQVGQGSGDSGVVKISGLAPDSGSLSGVTQGAPGLDCYLEVFKEGKAYLVKEMTRDSK